MADLSENIDDNDQSNDQNDRKEEKEKRAKKLLQSLRNKESDAMAKFFDLFSDDIYNFPIRVFQLSDDDAGDFYLYAFEHLKNGKRLLSFKGKSKFITWFYSVLRNLVIDFLRSRRNRLKESTLSWADARSLPSSGTENDVSLISDQPIQNEFFNNFENELKDLPIEKRVLLKLAYIHFLDLNSEEFLYLCEVSNLDKDNAIKKLKELKELGHERAVKVREFEEKLTTNFQSILALEYRLQTFFRENPEIPCERNEWHIEYTMPLLPIKIVDSIRALMKKRNRQVSLLEKQQKSLLNVRIPYSELARLLNSTQGVLSVQLVRTIEKITRSI